MAAIVIASGFSIWTLNRQGRIVHLRWHNQLNPAIKKDSWTPEEDQLIIELQVKHGNAWAKIADQLDGRTDNAVKNRWHSSLLKMTTCRVTRSKRQATKRRGASTKKVPKVVAESVSSPTAVDAILQVTGGQLSAEPLSSPPSLALCEPQRPSASIKMEVYEEQQRSFHDLLDEHTFGTEGMSEVKSEAFHSFQAFEAPQDPSVNSSYSPLVAMLLSDECLDGGDDDGSPSSSLEPFPFSQCVPSVDADLFLLNSVWKGEVATPMDAMAETEVPSSFVDHHEPSAAFCAPDEALSSSVMTPFAIFDAPALFSGGYSFPMPSHTDNMVVGMGTITADYGNILL